MSTIHEPFEDDGVTYCGYDGHKGCGETWPCSTVRAAGYAASLRAAREKVAALPADHRAALEGEFQRAEHEARQIMQVGVARHCIEPDYTGLQADLDELEATDPEVAAAAKQLDATTPDLIARVLSARRKGDIDVLAQLLWDTNAESMGWLDCYKNAEAIVTAGWHR